MSFTAGTLIDSFFGPARVEDLRPGDWVLTQEAGPQPLRSRAALSFTPTQLALLPRGTPVLIRAGALRRGVPARDTLVTPGQMLCTSDGRVLPAAALIDGRRILAARPRRAVTFVSLGLDEGWTLTANGAPMEANRALRGIEGPRRAAMLARAPAPLPFHAAGR